MKRLLFVILLTGCGCSQQQIVPEAQAEMTQLASSYKLAHEVEHRFCQMEVLPQPCIAARKAGYDVEAAITTANGERTETAIGEARRKMGAYEVAVGEVL